MKLIYCLRKGLRRLGVDVHRYPYGTSEDRGARLLRHHDISVVLDVGANKGQFASKLRAHGYDKRIISFEPLSAAAQILSERASQDPGWTAIRSAIGGTTGNVTLNVAENSVSSSILPILERHVSAAPDSRYIGHEDVPMITLAEAADRFLEPRDRVFLKVDTQGYEAQVLDSVGVTWDLIVGIQVELSLVPLYQGEMLFAEGLVSLADRGFSLMGVEPGFTDPESGRMLQVDAVLYRECSAESV